MPNKKLFIVVDSEPADTFVTFLEAQPHVDSLLVYSTLAALSSSTENSQRHYITKRCANEQDLETAIQQSREELNQQSAAFSMYNQKEKATRDLSKESGSFLFFQMFKNVIRNMPKTEEAKKTMISNCRNYYRGNMKELANIEEFDLTYKSTEAIQWYTKESFVYK